MTQKRKNGIPGSITENKSSIPHKSAQAGAAQSKDVSGKSPYGKNQQEAAFTQGNVTSFSKASQQAQQNVEEIGRQAWEKWARSADTAVDSLDDLVALNKQAADATFKCLSASGDIAQAIGEEISSLSNDVIAENIEALEGSFACRTINDFIDLQNELFRANSSRATNAALKIMELSAAYANAAEPIAEAASEISEKAAKIFSAE